MPALFAVVSTCLLKEPATQLFFPVCGVELQKHPWCLPFLLWRKLANQRNLPSNSRKSRVLNTPTQTVLIMSVPLHLLWSWIHNSTLMHPLYIHIPDNWLETCGTCYLYEIGFLMVAGCLSMGGFQWKLNLWKVWWCYVADELFWQKPVSLNLHNTRDQKS